MGRCCVISRIIEVFSSIQGEGELIGKRQIFIRFAGCNINCKYCDTQESLSDVVGDEYSYDMLNDKIESLMSTDFHSLEITGGEPLLSYEYIGEFLRKYPYKAMLETNATLPENMRKISDVIDLVSMDIKLPEHFSCEDEWKSVYANELKTIDVLEEENVNYYIKIVVSPTTPLDIIRKVRDDIKMHLKCDVNIIIQPVSPMSLWTSKDNLFRISELMGVEFNVSIIPQIHKYLDVE